MIKAVLVDDEKKSTLTLQKLLEKNCSDFTIVGQAEGIADAIILIKKTEPDVVFLDIEMADGSGFDLLKKFDNPFFYFVFVTAYSRYAVKAFKYSAVDYLLKPVDVDDLKQAAEKIRKLMREGILLKKIRYGKGRMLSLGLKKDSIYVSSDEIVRLTALGSYTKVIMLDGKEQIISVNIGTMEEKIADKDFIRVHRSDIININHIRRLIKDGVFYVEMTGGAKVEVSRRSRTILLAALKEREQT